MDLLGASKRLSAPSRRLSLAAVVLVGVTVIATALTIWDRREESIASYRREVTNLCLFLPQQTAHPKQKVEPVFTGPTPARRLGVSHNPPHTQHSSGAC